MQRVLPGQLQHIEFYIDGRYFPLKQVVLYRQTFIKKVRTLLVESLYWLTSSLTRSTLSSSPSPLLQVTLYDECF